MGLLPRRGICQNPLRKQNIVVQGEDPVTSALAGEKTGLRRCKEGVDTVGLVSKGRQPGVGDTAAQCTDI